MAKRGAAEQLTDRNWDREDEPEQAGRFKVAGGDQLSKRVIKKAKRRVPGSEGAMSGFKAFQGFGIPQKASTPTNNTTSTFAGFKGFGNHAEKKGSSVETVTSTEKTKDCESAYLAQLKRLNIEVCEWINKKVTEDPYVDLSPVFRDYEKHMLNLEKKFPVSNPGEAGVNFTSTNLVSIGNIHAIRGALSSVGTPTFNGDTTNKMSREVNVEKPSDEADDMPKTQSQVKSTPEEDAFYSIRCKLFFKRDDQWAELGVGMLSLKKIEKKVQVLIRNDTALGKILLNVFISSATPTSRSGKNNVLLMSVPNPPVFGKEGDNSKPVSYLIRVKTAENADELQKHLQAARDSA